MILNDTIDSNSSNKSTRMRYKNKIKNTTSKKQELLMQNRIQKKNENIEYDEDVTMEGGKKRFKNKEALSLELNQLNKLKGFIANILFKYICQKDNKISLDKWMEEEKNIDIISEEKEENIKKMESLYTKEIMELSKKEAPLKEEPLLNAILKRYTAEFIEKNMKEVFREQSKNINNINNNYYIELNNNTESKLENFTNYFNNKLEIQNVINKALEEKSLYILSETNTYVSNLQQNIDTLQNNIYNILKEREKNYNNLCAMSEFIRNCLNDNQSNIMQFIQAINNNMANNNETINRYINNLIGERNKNLELELENKITTILNEKLDNLEKKIVKINEEEERKKKEVMDKNISTIHQELEKIISSNEDQRKKWKELMDKRKENEQEYVNKMEKLITEKTNNIKFQIEFDQLKKDNELMKNNKNNNKMDIEIITLKKEIREYLIKFNEIVNEIGKLNTWYIGVMKDTKFLEENLKSMRQSINMLIKDSRAIDLTKSKMKECEKKVRENEENCKEFMNNIKKEFWDKKYIEENFKNFKEEIEKLKKLKEKIKDLGNKIDNKEIPSELKNVNDRINQVIMEVNNNKNQISDLLLKYQDLVNKNTIMKDNMNKYENKLSAISFSNINDKKSLRDDLLIHMKLMIQEQNIIMPKNGGGKDGINININNKNNDNNQSKNQKNNNNTNSKNNDKDNNDDINNILNNNINKIKIEIIEELKKNKSLCNRENCAYCKNMEEKIIELEQEWREEKKEKKKIDESNNNFKRIIEEKKETDSEKYLNINKALKCNLEELKNEYNTNKEIINKQIEENKNNNEIIKKQIQQQIRDIKVIKELNEKKENQIILKEEYLKNINENLETLTKEIFDQEAKKMEKRIFENIKEERSNDIKELENNIKVCKKEINEFTNNNKEILTKKDLIDYQRKIDEIQEEINKNNNKNKNNNNEIKENNEKEYIEIIQEAFKKDIININKEINNLRNVNCNEKLLVKKIKEEINEQMNFQVNKLKSPMLEFSRINNSVIIDRNVKSMYQLKNLINDNYKEEQENKLLNYYNILSRMIKENWNKEYYNIYVEMEEVYDIKKSVANKFIKKKNNNNKNTSTSINEQEIIWYNKSQTKVTDEDIIINKLEYANTNVDYSGNLKINVNMEKKTINIMKENNIILNVCAICFKRHKGRCKYISYFDSIEKIAKENDISNIVCQLCRKCHKRNQCKLLRNMINFLKIFLIGNDIKKEGIQNIAYNEKLINEIIGEKFVNLFDKNNIKISNEDNMLKKKIIEELKKKNEATPNIINKIKKEIKEKFVTAEYITNKIKEIWYVEAIKDIARLIKIDEEPNYRMDLKYDKLNEEDEIFNSIIKILKNHESINEALIERYNVLSKTKINNLQLSEKRILNKIKNKILRKIALNNKWIRPKERIDDQRKKEFIEDINKRKITYHNVKKIIKERKVNESDDEERSLGESDRSDKDNNNNSRNNIENNNINNESREKEKDRNNNNINISRSNENINSENKIEVINTNLNPNKELEDELVNAEQEKEEEKKEEEKKEEKKKEDKDEEEDLMNYNNNFKSMFDDDT